MENEYKYVIILPTGDWSEFNKESPITLVELDKAIELHPTMDAIEVFMHSENREASTAHFYVDEDRALEIESIRDPLPF